MPSESLRARERSVPKTISGPMLLAAHWAKHAEESVRIQVTVVNRELPLRSPPLISGFKRRK